MLASLLINLLASLIWFILGLAAYHMGRLIVSVQPVKKLWNLGNNKNLIICVAASAQIDTGKYLRPTTGIGQVRAIGYIIESLSAAYDVKIENIFLSTDQVQRQIEKDLIVLGGPKNNEIARLFLDKFSEMGIVQQNENRIHWLHGEQKTYEGTTQNGVVVKDYGLIIRVANPFSSLKKTSFSLFTGCHTFGTIAAAKYFTENYIREIKPWHKIRNNVVMLVECDVVNEYPTALKIVQQYEF